MKIVLVSERTGFLISSVCRHIYEAMFASDIVCVAFIMLFRNDNNVKYHNHRQTKRKRLAHKLLSLLFLLISQFR